MISTVGTVRLDEEEDAAREEEGPPRVCWEDRIGGTRLEVGGRVTETISMLLSKSILLSAILIMLLLSFGGGLALDLGGDTARVVGALVVEAENAAGAAR